MAKMAGGIDIMIKALVIHADKAKECVSICGALGKMIFENRKHCCAKMIYLEGNTSK